MLLTTVPFDAGGGTGRLREVTCIEVRVAWQRLSTVVLQQVFSVNLWSSHFTDGFGYRYYWVAGGMLWGVMMNCMVCCLFGGYAMPLSAQVVFV